jgi:hypothetical protein
MIDPAYIVAAGATILAAIFLWHRSVRERKQRTEAGLPRRDIFGTITLTLSAPIEAAEVDRVHAILQARAQQAVDDLADLGIDLPTVRIERNFID